MRWTSSLLGLAVLGIASTAVAAPAFRDDAASRDRARIQALRSLEGRLQGRGIALSDLKAVRTEIDERSMAHTRLQQTHGGVKVWHGEAIVHLNADGSTFATTDALVSDIRVETAPRLSRGQAIKIATRESGHEGHLTAKPVADLWVMREDRDHLVWRVQLRREDGTDRTSMPVVFVDATDGAVVHSYENLQTGSGSSLYSGTVTVNSSLSGSTYYMEDLTNKIGTFDNRNTPSTNQGAGTTYRFTDTDDSWTATTQRAAVDAQYGALKTYQYYKNVHGRNGIDGSGGPGYYTAAANTSVALITSKVHYGVNFNNAYWNGSFMTYGDGNGSTFSPLVTLDIAGHEMTHGVTERTAALTYERQSGALNESMSDVFGTMVERYTKASGWNWKIGEDAYTPGTSGDALRYMNDAHSGGQPDHWSEVNQTQLNASVCDDTNDSCGVHTNSGLSNFAFYCVAAGCTHHLGGSVTGIGADAAAAIWYKALTTYMTSGTTFSGARTATLSAATALYGSGSTNYNAVCNAWAVVGIGSSCNGGGGGGGGTELFSNGGFEGSASPWTLSTSFLYIANGSYPHGGTGYIYAGTTDNESSTAYQQISVPSGGATLSFWLNVTSNETTTTTAYDKLFVEVRNTSGTLLGTLATYSNLNKGTAGSYSQKSFSLASYAGQTVRVQFRVTTDPSLTTTFRVDDASAK